MALTEEPERGANMIISFARDKELKLDASPQEVVQAIQAIGEQLDDDEISDMELTQEELESVSGGIFPFILAAKAFVHLGLAGAGIWAAGKSARIWYRLEALPVTPLQSLCPNRAFSFVML